MWIRTAHQKLLSALFAVALSTTPLYGLASTTPPVAQGKVEVDFNTSRGPLLRSERYSNVTRAHRYVEQRDADVAFYNEQGLHGEVYRVWIDAHRIRDPGNPEAGYDYSGVEDYLDDLSRLSDNLLVVMDTRVEVRDHGYTPDQIKPIVKTILSELKQRFPAIRYIEAFNEPDHNLARAITPDLLYDYYKPYYEAVNEINEELAPETPLEVGGPALMQYNEPWLQAFLDGFAADTSPAKRLDFLSWHAYGEFPEGDGNTEGPRAYHFFKGDPSEVANQREALEAELRDRGLDETIPAFITELGIYPGPSFDHQDDPLPDYVIQAAGVPSLIYWFLEQVHMVPFNWVMRHFQEERKDQLVTRAGEGNSIPTNIFTPYGNTLLMMSKLKDERVEAHSDSLVNGKGIYALATKDDSGLAVMVWNYQHTGDQAFDVTLALGDLPENLRHRTLIQREFRIDARTSNYWADPEKANLQQVAETLIEPDGEHSTQVHLDANALHLIVLEPAE